MKLNLQTRNGGRRWSGYTPGRFAASLACVTAGLLFVACVELEYTDDGVPIVPYAGTDTPATIHRVAGADLEFVIEAWTNRMPGPPSGSGTGYPLGILLRITPDGAGRAVDSILVPALSLWSPGGDSLLAALPLARLDGTEPWVRLGSDAAPTELTAARSPVRRLGGPPDIAASPRMMVQSRGRTLLLALPETRVTAAY